MRKCMQAHTIMISRCLIVSTDKILMWWIRCNIRTAPCTIYTFIPQNRAIIRMTDNTYVLQQLDN